MNKVLLLMLISALLVPLGLAQTPDAASNTDQANVTGCLGGSEGNYTVTEDGTGQIFKITTSSVDLKSHLGHDVKLVGHKASGTVTSGAADNSFAVTELNMISEHCAAAAAVPAATAIPSSGNVTTPPSAATTPAVTASPSPETVNPPPADTPAPNAAAPAATASPSSGNVTTPPSAATTPAVTASPSSGNVTTPPAAATTPAATASPSAESVSPPAVDTSAPAATVRTSSATVSAPAEGAAHTTGPSARSHRASRTKTAAAPAETANSSAETVSPPAADAAAPAADATTPVATASPSAETVSPTAPAATTPSVTHKGGSLWLLILIGVLVIALGTLTPLLSRWRKRKMLERTGTPNLSLTKEVSSDRDKPAPRKAA